MTTSKYLNFCFESNCTSMSITSSDFKKPFPAGDKQQKDFLLWS